MFGLAQRPVKTRGELGQTFDHLVQAASHAANGVGSTVGPRVSAARGLVQKNGLVQKKKKGTMTRKRGLMLAGLLAAGAAVGAVGALVTRRRRQPTWEEYAPEPTPAAETTRV